MKAARQIIARCWWNPRNNGRNRPVELREQLIRKISSANTSEPGYILQCKAIQGFSRTHDSVDYQVLSEDICSYMSNKMFFIIW
jgi:hypothetical protein